MTRCGGSNFHHACRQSAMQRHAQAGITAAFSAIHGHDAPFHREILDALRLQPRSFAGGVGAEAPPPTRASRRPQTRGCQTRDRTSPRIQEIRRTTAPGVQGCPNGGRRRSMTRPVYLGCFPPPTRHRLRQQKCGQGRPRNRAPDAQRHEGPLVGHVRQTEPLGRVVVAVGLGKDEGALGRGSNVSSWALAGGWPIKRP